MKSTYQTVSQAIQEVTGLEEADITLDASLEEDLGVDMLSDFPAIITEINHQLEIKLPLQNQDFIEDLKECETVAELVDLIEEAQL